MQLPNIPVQMDFMQNGSMITNNDGLADVMANSQTPQSGFDPGLMRPFVDSKGRRCVMVNTGQVEQIKNDRGEVLINKETGLPQYRPVLKTYQIKDLVQNGYTNPVWNATRLTKDQWIQLDTTIMKAARKRLRAVSDLRSASTIGGFDGFATTIFEYQQMTDPGEAIVDMKGVSEGRADAPEFQLQGMLLPITHSNFTLFERELQTSRRGGGQPLDTALGEAAGRRVSEALEKTLIGVQTGITYGVSTDYNLPSQVYGYTNYPDRVTKTDFTAPTDSAWTPNTLHNEVLAFLDDMRAVNHFGPFMMYHSTDWSQYIDRVFSDSGGNHPSETARTMLRKIDEIEDVRRLDFLTDTFTILLVQMTSDVVSWINGMDVTTIQWESHGGMQLNFKVMTVAAPLFRSDASGQTGVGHGTTA